MEALEEKESNIVQARGGEDGRGEREVGGQRRISEWKP